MQSHCFHHCEETSAPEGRRFRLEAATALLREAIGQVDRHQGSLAHQKQ